MTKINTLEWIHACDISDIQTKGLSFTSLANSISSPDKLQLLWQLLLKCLACLVWKIVTHFWFHVLYLEQFTLDMHNLTAQLVTRNVVNNKSPVTFAGIHLSSQHSWNLQCKNLKPANPTDTNAPVTAVTVDTGSKVNTTPSSACNNRNITIRTCCMICCMCFRLTDKKKINTITYSSVVRSVRRTERLVTKITIISSPNWVKKIGIY